MTRVVAGALGGRKLTVPAGRNTRPTAERVREGLFSTLESLWGPLAGAAFLDLYAGSGAVGIEAASRGAGRVTFVERDPRAVAVLRGNLDALEVQHSEVVSASVGRFVGDRAVARFDLVYVDPPYAEAVDDTLAMLQANDWLEPGAVVVVERATRDSAPVWPAGLVLDRTRRYGDTTLWYGRRP
ncbi:MAG TPA: 16S rRNA (guanine(966)-N(2))-methyltransferase RsmD [Mycobacteriales bacterium]|nr:16S rRNA (guanine(966)-N(2))-methyltransferase RsmD [Mycobacteriales bacterium]